MNYERKPFPWTGRVPRLDIDSLGSP
jgi:hypothetical protein